MGSNILVIDDDPLVRKTLRVILEDEGYSVRCAKDGRDGLAAFREGPPDLVITDIIMPEQEGLETIMAIRSAWPEGAIIAISGGGRIQYADILHAAKRLGADAILAKPFEPHELIATVKSCWQERLG